MKVIIPPFLKKGSHITIVCASGYLPFEKSEQAARVLEEWGYKVTLGTTTRTENAYFSGTDEERLADLQRALDHPDTDAILMGRGGYGLSRIIDRLDFRKFKKRPKWILGFSDVTVLQAHIFSTLHIAAMHAPMCSAFAAEHLDQPHMKAYRNLLRGKQIRYRFPGHPRNIPGQAEGVLVGGNLCMLAHLTGSASALDTRGKILFIEDIGEHLYKVDRMLYTLKRSGQLAELKGLICGNFSDMEDTVRPFGQELHDIISAHVADLDIPVAFEVPCGHETVNYPLTLGASYRLETTKKGTIIQQL
ncbi:MAG: LD-carboxypeptidase [Bacteroidetes bacterium 47-18]|nr:MAG: LD-carboxypeptidase [Bacteroidetes bacterium 47-18]